MESISKPISAAQEHLSPETARAKASCRASIFADLPVTQKMKKIEGIQRKTQQLDRKLNPAKPTYAEIAKASMADKESSSGTPKSEGESLPSAPLKLPRAIVFGDEKAGKSSTIERIAQNDIFPRDMDICTRMPTVLKLRPNKDFKTNEPMFYLTVPECRHNGVVYNKEEVCANLATKDVGEIRDRIKRQMEAIKRSGKSCESDQEITVELHSDGVLNIDLVDLPGLRQVAEASDTNTVEALEECAKKYIASPETGVILCVLNAQNPNIQTTASLRLLKGLDKTNPRVTHSCVAVLTNTDRSVDCQWEECGQSSPCYRVEQLLSQCDTDGAGAHSTESELRSMFKAGFVALVNRSQTNLRTRNHSLDDALEHEMNWFVTKSGMTKFGAISQETGHVEAAGETRTLNEQGAGKLGLPALVDKIDKVIRHFMSEEYIPEEIKKQQVKAETKRTELEALGIKPDLAQKMHSSSEFLPQPHHMHYEKAERLSAQAVIKSATEKVNKFLLQHIEGLDFTSAVDKSEFDRFNSARLRLEKSQVRLQLERTVMASICAVDEQGQGSAIARRVINAVLEGIRTQFNTDQEGDVQLARFDQLARVFQEEARKDMEASLPAFQEDACAKLLMMLAWSSGCANLDTVQGTAANLHSMICGMLVESAIQSLLCPLLAPGSFQVGPDSAFLQRVQALVDKDAESFHRNKEVVTFVESKEHLGKRAALEECLKDIHEVIREWNELLLPLPQGSQLGDAVCGKQHCELHVQVAGVEALLPSVQQATSA
jgi:hypothetical protein